MFVNLRAAAIVVLGLLLPVAAPAQQLPAPVGVWQCVVNSPHVSIQLQMQVAPNGQLGGQGYIIYNQTSAQYQVQGGGDWTVIPPEPGAPRWAYKFRMFPSNHAIFAWYAAPTDNPNWLYNVFQNPQTAQVTETSCERIG